MSLLHSYFWCLTCEYEDKKTIKLNFFYTPNLKFRFLSTTFVNLLSFVVSMRRGELFDYLTEKVTLSEKETR